MTESAIYEGWVAHRRSVPAERTFRYRIFLPLFDLDELPELLDGIPLWSARRPSLVRFRASDHLPGNRGSLADRARDLVQVRLGHRPEGPVRLLANPRYLGVGFNPVSFLFLHSTEGGVDGVIAEVTNTPWGERTAYVLDGRGAAGAVAAGFTKRMHVSPFQPMEQAYEISLTEPGERLAVGVRSFAAGREVLTATMALRRHALTRSRMVSVLLRYPPATLATLSRIYWNALRLKVGGAPYHPHPSSAGTR
jgi:hypothetical protein